MALRAWLYASGLLPSKTLPCKVISIGNLVAGGTGKTPMTILVAKMVKKLGYRVVVISRGYGGEMERRGGVVSDGRMVFKNAREVGDEPYQMANRLNGIPVVVGSRRYDAGMLAIDAFNPDVIVLDDAFQHLGLHRDMNIVLMDHRLPFGNGHILPRGVLREPISALTRAHAIVLTRAQDKGSGDALVRDRLQTSLPIFYAGHELVVRKVIQARELVANGAEDLTILIGKKVVAFAGLANNDQFFDSLTDAGCDLVHTLSYADHFYYSTHDLNTIADVADSFNADLLVTTFKDYVKFERKSIGNGMLAVVDVEARFIDRLHVFASVIEDRINAQERQGDNGFIEKCNGRWQ